MTKRYRDLGSFIADDLMAHKPAAAQVGERQGSQHNHVYHGPGGRCIACDLTEAEIAAAIRALKTDTPATQTSVKRNAIK